MRDLLKKLILEIDERSELFEKILTVVSTAVLLIISIFALTYVPWVFGLLLAIGLLFVWVFWGEIVKWAKK